MSEQLAEVVKWGIGGGVVVAVGFAFVGLLAYALHRGYTFGFWSPRGGGGFLPPEPPPSPPPRRRR